MKMEVSSKAALRAVKSKVSKRWHGAIEGVYCGLVYGWAVDAERPQARVVLELCLNDDPICSLVADLARTDLTPRFADAVDGVDGIDACHGFATDAGIDPKAQGVLSVRVANTDHILDGRIPWAAAGTPPASAISHVQSDGALRLHGWALDPGNEKRKIVISAHVGSTKVAEAVANRHTPGLRGTSADGHAFTLNLPLSMADGRSHTVRVTDEQGLPINGSPVTVCAIAAGARALLPAGDALASDVVDMYERFLPRSLGFEHYCAWTDAFENDAVAPSSLRVALVVAPADKTSSDEALAATVLSLQRQRHVKIDVFTAESRTEGFRAALDLAHATGCDVIGCIRAGDTLPEHALASALAGFELPGSQLVYTDSEFNGKPWFKPAWNPDYAYGTDYPLELMLVRSALVEGARNQGPQQKRGAKKANAGIGPNPSTFAWQALAAAAKTAEGVVHVPRVLYQFKSQLSGVEIAERHAACVEAVAAMSPCIEITPHEGPFAAYHSTRRVTRPLKNKERQTSVSLIIPTRDHADMLARCIDSIDKYTDWPNLEIIVIDNGSVEAATRTYLRKIVRRGVRVLAMPGPFNFADLNNRAIECASGDIVGLVNNDIEALHDGWLDEIVGQLLRPEVGAVGAKLLWPNDMVQHGGVLIGVNNAAGHFGNLLADRDWGDHGRNQLVQQVSGVTAACLFIRRADYIALGGMDGAAFPVAFNDVDLCLKMRAAGKAIVWTPNARLLHAESASRGQEDSRQKQARALRELEGLRKRWGHVLLRDPAYHPSLNLDVNSHAFGGLAIPPRDRSPRTATLPASVPANAASGTALAASRNTTAAKTKVARTKKMQ